MKPIRGKTMISPVSPVFGSGTSRRDDPLPPFQAARAVAATISEPDAAPRPPADLVRAFETALNAALPQPLLPQTRLIIEVDSDTRRFVYKSIDAQSGELVRQWPAEEILGMIKIMRSLSGIAVDKKA
jgi:hypothetical protein